MQFREILTMALASVGANKLRSALTRIVGDPEEAGQLLVERNEVHTRTSCTTCHR